MLSNFASEPYRRPPSASARCGFFDKSQDFDRVREFVAQRAASSRREIAMHAAVIAIQPVEQRMPVRANTRRAARAATCASFACPAALDARICSASRTWSTRAAA